MKFWYWLVSFLPFEWAAPDSMFFMKHALLAVLVVTPLFGLLSTMVVESRMSFFSDALGHSAFTGIAIGALCGLADPMWAAVLLSLAFAVLFTYVRRRSDMASDTVIGVFSSTAVALGIFIATLDDMKVLSDVPSATYAYYHANIKPKPQAKPAESGERWVCKVCGYVHEGPLPADFICPLCKHPASDFERM